MNKKWKEDLAHNHQQVEKYISGQEALAIMYPILSYSEPFHCTGPFDFVSSHCAAHWLFFEMKDVIIIQILTVLHG